VHLASVRPDVPRGLSDAVDKAMSVDPEKRFPDLHAFGAAIRTFASPQAKLTWEAHFTSSAPSRRASQMSIAVGTSDDINRRSLGDATTLDTRKTGPTFSSRPDRRRTVPVGTGQLRIVSG